MEILAVIPARGNSKAIPRKNLADLGGKPLLAWTTAAALSAPSLSRIVCSTEDPEIAHMACQLGIEVRQRPEALAEDQVTAVTVVRHTVQQLYTQNGYVPEVVLMLLPTSPFRTARHIEDAIALWRRRVCDAIVGVKQLHGQTLETIRTQDEFGYLVAHTSTAMLRQRQEQTPLYRVNGAIFLIAERALLLHKSFHTPYAIPYVMPEESSLEIDEPEDLGLARYMVQEGYRCE